MLAIERIKKIIIIYTCLFVAAVNDIDRSACYGDVEINRKEDKISFSITLFRNTHTIAHNYKEKFVCLATIDKTKSEPTRRIVLFSRTDCGVHHQFGDVEWSFRNVVFNYNEFIYKTNKSQYYVVSVYCETADGLNESAYNSNPIIFRLDLNRYEYLDLDKIYSKLDNDCSKLAVQLLKPNPMRKDDFANKSFMITESLIDLKKRKDIILPYLRAFNHGDKNRLEDLLEKITRIEINQRTWLERQLVD